MPGSVITPLATALDWVVASPILSTTLVATVYFLYKILHLLVISPWRSQLEVLGGPPKPGKFFDMTDLRSALDTQITYRKHQEFRQKYGKNVRVQGFGYWDQRLLTFDTKAINYILCQATELYPKAWQSRQILSRLLGDGVAVMEGEQHKRQRKVINPAFAPQALKRLYPIFHSKAAELRDRLTGVIGSQPHAQLDINHWLGRATFDAFALAGFDYQLSVIQNEDHPLYLAYKKMFDAAVNKGQTIRGFLEVHFPWLDWVLPDAVARQVKKSKAVIKKAGDEMLRSKRDAILQEKTADYDEEKDIPKDQRDILSLLIKSNLAEDQKMTDAEILAQIHSFLFVGSDSVSLSICWTLYYLSLNPTIQSRLRDELLPHAASFNSPNAPDLSTFPFLDAVVKESLRLTTPVQSTLRVASCDDTIPTEDGQGVKIRAGQFIHIPFEAMNIAKEVWGPDAWQFNPDRWTNLPAEAKKIPGLVSGLMSFSVGSHACPGVHFAIMETKAFIAGLITAFEFAPAPEKKIAKINAIVTRPFVVGDWEKGTQLPMRIRPYAPPS